MRFLSEIELAATEIFPEGSLPDNIRSETLPLYILQAALSKGCLWVASDSMNRPVGFIVLRVIKDIAYIIELDVHPDHHRKSIGKALIEAATVWARAQKLSALTLTTFSTVPWNAPYYERLGFRRLEEYELEGNLAAQLEDEDKRGLKDRVAMRLNLNK
ncbi:MAG: GNAT family N-acetyltransferase [Spirochaetes bacterium]|nr:GNAT family N-acetyltransferase [Spirochaetota bacterium]